MNRVEINEAKFERVMWRRKDGVYEGKLSIMRKALGDFEITLKVEAGSEKTSVKVHNYSYPILDWGNEYESYSKAIEGVKQYFDEVAETRFALVEAEARAEEEKQRNVTKALIEILKRIGEQRDGNERKLD